MISVVIPTYNEAKNLEVLLPFLLQCEAHIDAIIISNSPLSSDDLSKWKDHQKIKIITAKKHQRACQLNEGAQYVSSPITYFLHADTLPPDSFIKDIMHAITHGYEAGCFSYKFDHPSRMLAINSKTTRKIGWFTGGGDQGLFIRTDLFKQMRGYDEQLDLMEDFDLYDRLKATAIPFILIPHDAKVSARKYVKNSWIKVNVIQGLVFLAYRMRLPQRVWKGVYTQLK